MPKKGLQPSGVTVHHQFLVPTRLAWCFNNRNTVGFPRGSAEESTCSTENAGEVGSIHGSGRSSGGGYGHSLQSSLLENPMDRGPGGLCSGGVAPVDTTNWSDLVHTMHRFFRARYTWNCVSDHSSAQNIFIFELLPTCSPALLQVLGTE